MTWPANGTSALSTFVTSVATHSSANASLMVAIFMIVGISLSPLTPLHQCYLSARQPGREPDGSRLWLVRTPGAHDVQRSRRGGAGYTPDGRVPGAHGRAPASV